MLRKLLQFVPLMALAAYAIAEPAVKAERPDVKVGDKYTETCTQGTRTYDRQTVITAVDESTIKFTRSGMSLESTRDWNPIKDERFSYTDRRNFSFPLEIGKAWRFTDHWARSDVPANGIAKGTVTVLAYEKVQVPAGEFDAFKLQWIADFTVEATNFSGTNRGVFWYAPAVRKQVKTIVNIVGEPESTCELKEFQLQR